MVYQFIAALLDNKINVEMVMGVLLGEEKFIPVCLLHCSFQDHVHGRN